MQSTVRELVMDFVGRSKVSAIEVVEKIPIVGTCFGGNLSGVTANYEGRISAREEKRLSRNVTLENK